jgi:hypothetical protein
VRAAASNPIEVYCNHCRVTFPMGSKRCIHCGGPLSRERMGPGVELAGRTEEALPEEELVTRRSPFSPLTLVWIALLAGAYVMRMCSAE